MINDGPFHSFFHAVMDTVWPLSVSCQGRTDIDVEWLNPTFPFTPPRQVFVQRVQLNGTCLYGNTTDLEVQIKESHH